jgi:hypothetical protein
VSTLSRKILKLFSGGAVASLVFQAIGAASVTAGFALLAPFAGFIAAGVLLILLGVALEREGR